MFTLLSAQSLSDMAGVDGFNLKAPSLTNERARFYFTEEGWRRVGRTVAANARREGRLVKVIRRKNPDAAQVVYRDELQVATLPRFDMVDCLAYYEAVRRATLRYLAGLTPADLERCPHPERRPGSTIGSMLSHLIVEGSQHLGQVVYLRGLQRGLEYPTSWVSSRTPWPDSRLQRGR